MYKVEGVWNVHSMIYSETMHVKKQKLQLDVRIDKVMLALWFICQDVYKYLAILFIVTIYCYFMVVHDLFFLKQLSIFYNLILIHVLLLALSIQSYLSCCSIIKVLLLPFCLGYFLKIYEERQLLIEIVVLVVMTNCTNEII